VAVPPETVIFFALSFFSLVCWVTLLTFPKLRKRMWPRYSFRPPPWRLVDVCGVWLALILLILLFNSVVQGTSTRRSNDDRRSVTTVARIHGDEKSTSAQRAHWAILLLSERPSVSTLLLVVISAGVLGPWVEEIVFRLFFQGWLHAQELRWRRLRNRLGRLGRNRMTGPGDEFAFLKCRPTLRRRGIPVGAMSVVMSASVFALLHARSTENVPDPETIRLILWARTLAYALFLAFFSVFISRRASSLWRQLGLSRTRIFPDVALGLGWFAAAALPIYGLQFFLSSIVPESIVVDPLTILIVGVILGVLYARTGRLLPSIAFHMSLNLTSLLLAWLLLHSQ